MLSSLVPARTIHLLVFLASKLSMLISNHSTVILSLSILIIPLPCPEFAVGFNKAPLSAVPSCLLAATTVNVTESKSAPLLPPIDIPPLIVTVASVKVESAYMTPTASLVSA